MCEVLGERERGTEKYPEVLPRQALGTPVGSGSDNKTFPISPLPFLLGRLRPSQSMSPLVPCVIFQGEVTM